MIIGLSTHEADLLRGVLASHPAVERAVLFGSRAKGTHLPSSDVDLAVFGDLDQLEAERIRRELDELPLPYLFDVVAASTLGDPGVRAHIERVGVPVYTAAPR
jgi:predicted nucleotidyltransferase